MSAVVAEMIDTPVYDEYVGGDVLARVIDIPQSLRKGQFHIVYNPVSVRDNSLTNDGVSISGNAEFDSNKVVDVKSLAGILSQYANPSKIKDENNGWKVAMEDKYGLS